MYNMIIAVKVFKNTYVFKVNREYLILNSNIYFKIYTCKDAVHDLLQ